MMEFSAFSSGKLLARMSRVKLGVKNYCLFVCLFSSFHAVCDSKLGMYR